MNPHDNAPLVPTACNACAASAYSAFHNTSRILRHLLPLLAAVAFILPDINAQTTGQSRTSRPSERLSQVQGLHGNEVHSILQDSRGYMWFGTEKGLNRYDGYSFTVYKNDPGDSSTLVDAGVQSLCEDKQGVLWVGTWDGLERFDRTTGAFSHFRPNPQAGRINITDVTKGVDYINVIYDVFEDSRGTLWVGGFGLKSFDRSTRKFALLPSTGSAAEEFLRTHMVDAVYEDHLGDLWVGATGALGRYSRSARTWTLEWIDENIEKGLPPDFLGNHWIQRIFEDRSGLLWLCTNNGTVTFNRKDGKFTPYSLYSPAPVVDGSVSVPSMVQDESGVLWIGTWGGGILTYNAQVARFELRSFHPSSPFNTVPALYADRAGIMWIGTSGQGLWRLVKEKRRFARYKHDPADPVRLSKPLHFTSSLQNDDVRYFYQEPAGYITIGTATGNDRFYRHKELFAHWASWEGPYACTGYLRSRFEPVIWLGCSAGVRDGVLRGIESPYSWTIFSPGEAGLGGKACSFHEDRRGMLWMLCSDAGLCRFDPHTGKFTKLGIGQVQPFVAARMIIEDSLDNTIDGWALWIGSQDGLFRYDARSNAFTRFAHDPRDPASLSSNSIITIFQDAHRNLWIGTRRGLDRMNHESRFFEHFTVDDGLPEDSLQGILEDRHGYLWVSTPRTLSKFDPRNKVFTSHSVKNVLQGIRFNPGCCLYSHDGEMYFGGEGGFVVFNPDSIEGNRFIPPIAITGFKTFGIPLPLDTLIEEKKIIELSYKETLFSIEFAALNFSHSENNQYSYMLEGYDPQWTYCGDRRSAQYMNVAPGRYTFKVKGSNNDGVWNEQGTSLAIIITPPWWKTTWFTILLWVTALGSVAGGVRFYERSKSKKQIAELERQHTLERERARISQDMHDEVGSSLSEIAILSELAKKKPDQAEVRVEEISERTAELIENVGEIVWAMNPKNDTLENLLSHIRRYAVKYLNLAGISCNFVMPETIPAISLASDVRRNVFLIVKEALHNVVKHAAASEVGIQVETGEHALVMRIQDNGKGFVLEARADAGNGLSSMRNRAADIGAMVDINSKPGSGTTVVLTVQA